MRLLVWVLSRSDSSSMAVRWIAFYPSFQSSMRILRDGIPSTSPPWRACSLARQVSTGTWPHGKVRQPTKFKKISFWTPPRFNQSLRALIKIRVLCALARVSLTCALPAQLLSLRLRDAWRRIHSLGFALFTAWRLLSMASCRNGILVAWLIWVDRVPLPFPSLMETYPTGIHRTWPACRICSHLVRLLIGTYRNGIRLGL